MFPFVYIIGLSREQYRKNNHWQSSCFVVVIYMVSKINQGASYLITSEKHHKKCT